MKIMPCPLNGPRNISEFICFGEVTEMPDPEAASDDDWADFVWCSNNTAGVVREWWFHVPTSYWFIAERDTVSDQILRTYPADQVFNQRREFAADDPGERR
ncbi:MAG: sarcosine oxidase subunit delta [Kiloniellales bacterium]